MSEDKKLKRRKFLADCLFAGGGLTAAAFLAKIGASSGGTEPPVATKTPVDPGTPIAQDPPMPGAAVPPKHPPELAGEVAVPEEPMIEGDVVTPDPVHVKGKVAAPEPATPGRMAVPQPRGNPDVDGNMVMPDCAK